MNNLKKYLINFGVLVAIPLLMAAFVRKEYVVEREIIIDKPQNLVFDYLKNQENYSQWGVDFASRSDKNNEILHIEEGKRIDFSLGDFGQFDTNDTAYFITEDYEGNKTKVRWGIKGKMAYPANLLLIDISIEQRIANDLETGLENLQSVFDEEYLADYEAR
ncbi:MAG: hypothetical protein MUF45_11815 [Spirosomaceae bacterium]|jgi:uncharacterized membrane protein|nr:hypothetical protein [Spirosomataceae bacterium]